MLRNNIIATYFGQIYVALIGITMVPLYIRIMGAEAYGLVGFFSMLQVWFSLLDFGLTPTVARETARFKGAAITAVEYLRLIRALEIVFLSVAVVGCLAIFVAAGYIATDWLKSEFLASEEIRRSVQLMAFAISMRWMCGLYRGTISGSERLVFLSVFSSAIASLRFVAVIPLLAYVDARPTTFFRLQSRHTRQYRRANRPTQHQDATSHQYRKREICIFGQREDIGQDQLVGLGNNGPHGSGECNCH